jgi:hypothetical protein
VLALMAAVLVLLGGGGEERPLSTDEYREQLVEALRDIQLDADPRDPQALREAAGEFKDLVYELTDFVPPPEVAATHGRFVNGLNDYARMLERLADAGPAGVIQLQQRLAELGGVTQHDWVQAFNELAAQGYVTYEPR